jgi:phosphotriesterase-related protein
MPQRPGSLIAAVIIGTTMVAGSPVLRSEAPAPDVYGKVVTVRGPVEPSELGLALMHEHIFIDYTLPLDAPEKWATAGLNYPDQPDELELWTSPLSIELLSRLQIAWPANRDALVFDDEQVAVNELMKFKSAGGGTVVALSNIGLGRRPDALRRASEKTGLHIVMGAGFYRDEWLADDLHELSIEEMTATIVSDLTEGIGGVRAGIIGEVGVESHPPNDPLTDTEIRSLAAAGRAARITGAPRSLHTLLVPRQQLEVLDRLEQDGMDLSRVIVGHLNAPVARDLDYLLEIARRGVYLQFDLIGFRESTVVEEFVDDRAVAAAIVYLFRNGFGDRVLTSQDTAMKLQLTRYGGYGYAFIPSYLLPYLKRHGLSDDELHRLVVGNPARALTYAEPDRQ